MKDKIEKLSMTTLDSLSIEAVDKAIKPIFKYWLFKSKTSWLWYRWKDKKYRKKLNKVRDAFKNGKTTFYETLGIIQKRMEWKADSIKKGGDIIELPETAWRRRKCDCEGFARLMHYIFGNEVTLGGTKYFLDGYRILFGKGSHVVLVYKNGLEFLVFSNESVDDYNLDEWNKYMSKYGKYEAYLDKNMKYKKVIRH